MIRRCVRLVLIGGSLALCSGPAFSQANQPNVSAQSSLASQAAPEPQLVQVNQQSSQLPAGGQPMNSPPVASEPPNPRDPLAPLNRKVLNVNVNVDRAALHPLAGAWAKIVPKPARRCVGRFFDNMKFIPRFTNTMLQMKLRDAGGELARFGINTTIGAAGLFDPAGDWFGIKEHDNDFGTTLKAWGMSDGLFVEMPVGGPINVRETIGHFVDGAMNPMNYVVPASGEIYEHIAHSIEGLNKRADDLDNFEGVEFESDRARRPTDATPNLYETVRANYLQQQRQNAAPNDATTEEASSVGGIRQ